jgi:hypothetical protein
MKSKVNDDPAHQQVAVWIPWRGLPNLEANLQQLDGWNNQDALAQPVEKDVQNALVQPDEDLQLKRSTQ